jgi:hypothetical protein
MAAGRRVLHVLGAGLPPSATMMLLLFRLHRGLRGECCKPVNGAVVDRSSSIAALEERLGRLEQTRTSLGATTGESRHPS